MGIDSRTGTLAIYLCRDTHPVFENQRQRDIPVFFFFTLFFLFHDPQKISVLFDQPDYCNGVTKIKFK